MRRSPGWPIAARCLSRKAASLPRKEEAPRDHRRARGSQHFARGEAPQGAQEDREAYQWRLLPITAPCHARRQWRPQPREAEAPHEQEPQGHRGREGEGEARQAIRAWRAERCQQQHGQELQQPAPARKLIEPLGQSAPRLQVPMPPSPTRHYPTFATSQQHPPQYTSLQPPVVGQVPRTVHPRVTYSYDEQAVYDEHTREYEDGNYNIHPLPREHRR